MGAILLFDGLCNLCNTSVQFVLKRDPDAYFRFASLQSEAGEELLRKFPDLPRDNSSIVLLEAGQCYTRSTAALRIARRLNGLWRVFYGFIILPRWLRDPLYDFVARRRYRWFGKRETCALPTPGQRARFLESRAEALKPQETGV